MLAILIVFAMIVAFGIAGRHEVRKEYYDEAMIDVVGRLGWADNVKENRRRPGFNQRVKNAKEIKAQAEKLWQERQWTKAVQRIWKAQKELDAAQKLIILDSAPPASPWHTMAEGESA